jgi:hypothetical protein
MKGVESNASAQKSTDVHIKCFKILHSFVNYVEIAVLAGFGVPQKT